MASLRSLLYSQNAKFSGSTSADYAADPSSASSTKRTGCQLNWSIYCQFTPDSSWGQACFCAWCWPAGVTTVTWDIWGGGGAGAGGCCCMQGTPGGSGAWAQKTLSGGTPGTCYCMCVAYPTDCGATCCGILGCTTRVTGDGLNNFCADGGFGGKACCFVMYGNYSCLGNTCCRLYLDCHDQNSCRCYYGADLGSPGKAGWLWVQCACGPCYWKQAIPYPGGLINSCGGYMLLRTQGFACNNEWLRCNRTIGWSYDSGYGFLPGSGGTAATSCGGGCCFGQPGAPGFIRITYE